MLRKPPLRRRQQQLPL
ncbi:unnamed protein product [Thlaspi arvense]|uniref:Uncharacterized protein n=1 Tax=Thlaspi arvense TaxID=13288 RepID=A0AAU9SI42_THLAR|nr:unnamed protein product [Thlaspi arvense]